MQNQIWVPLEKCMRFCQNWICTDHTHPTQTLLQPPHPIPTLPNLTSTNLHLYLHPYHSTTLYPTHTEERQVRNGTLVLYLDDTWDLEIILHLDDFVDFCCTTLRRLRRHMLSYTNGFVDLYIFATLKDFVDLDILLHLPDSDPTHSYLYSISTFTHRTHPTQTSVHPPHTIPPYPLLYLPTFIYPRPYHITTSYPTPFRPYPLLPILNLHIYPPYSPHPNFHTPTPHHSTLPSLISTHLHLYPRPYPSTTPYLPHFDLTNSYLY